MGDIREGFAAVARRPLLRSFLATDAVVTLFNAMLETVYILYITRRLGIGAGLLGLVFSAGGIGFLVGALVAQRVAKRVGVGPAAIVGLAAAALGDAALPLARGPLPLLVAFLVAGQVLFGVGLTVYSVGRSSLVQGSTPTRLRGRVGATIRFVMAALVPVGALLGGALGQAIDLRTTLFIAVAGELLGAAWLVLSPVRRQRLQPDPVE
ncbi:MAG: MFS transporter [Anaerolineae bacterium]